jgi:hypothetical protein
VLSTRKMVLRRQKLGRMALFTTALGLYGGVLWSGELLQGSILHEMVPTPARAAGPAGATGRGPRAGCGMAWALGVGCSGRWHCASRPAPAGVPCPSASADALRLAAPAPC